MSTKEKKNTLIRFLPHYSPQSHFHNKILSASVFPAGATWPTRSLRTPCPPIHLFSSILLLFFQLSYPPFFFISTSVTSYSLLFGAHVLWGTCQSYSDAINNKFHSSPLETPHRQDNAHFKHVPREESRDLQKKIKLPKNKIQTCQSWKLNIHFPSPSHEVSCAIHVHPPSWFLIQVSKAPLPLLLAMKINWILCLNTTSRALSQLH